MIDLKQQIEESIRIKSKALKWDEIEECSAIGLAIEYGVTRQKIAKILDQLHEEGVFIKVVNQPNIFFHKVELTKYYRIYDIPNVFISIQEFRSFIEKEYNVCENLVGYNGSLKYAVEQCKSAINYPNNGLPILLYGESGTGKSYLASLLFEYGKQKGLIPVDGKFVTVNCAEYSNNPELFLTNLFGYTKGAYTGAEEDKEGLLSIADNGMIFMDEIHSLRPECQEKIFLFMDKGIFHKVGDNETWYSSKIRLIFATTENPSNALLKTLLRRIPIVVTLPPLDKRFLKEKKEIIYNVLSEEEKMTKRIIQISRQAYQMLLNYKYSGNIGELKNVIKYMVANSLVTSLDKNVIVKVNNLPIYIVETQSKTINSLKDDRILLSIDELKDYSKTENELYTTNLEFIELIQRWIDKKLSLDALVSKCTEIMGKYVDYLFFEELNPEQYTEKLIINLMTNITNIISHKYLPINFSNHEIGVLAKFVIDNKNSVQYDDLHFDEEIKKIELLLEQLSMMYSYKMQIANELLILLSDSELMKKNNVGKMNLFFLLSYLKKDVESSRIPGIIISHGYSIASGIAEVVNQLVGQHVFDAIDMPISSDVQQITNRLIEKIENTRSCNELIVLVDMGSLEQINNGLGNKFKTDIGIINNVTTRMALDVANRIMQNEDMESILKNASTANYSKYSFIKNRIKPDAILSICESGIGMANKIAQLIDLSLPHPMNVQLLTYDFKNLQVKGNDFSMFEKYNVLFIVGNQDPKIEKIPFLSIEGLIEKQDEKVIYELFQGKLNRQQVHAFKKNIIKNFSLENLMSHLNIIDPRKIIVSVERIIDKLQKELQMEFSSGGTLGLYIHICCLIERMVTNKNYLDDNKYEFDKERYPQFDLIKGILLEIEQLYKVSLPNKEIVYLIDYINANRRFSDQYENSNDLFEL